jgi:hypothetical protein
MCWHLHAPFTLKGGGSTWVAAEQLLKLNFLCNY